VRWAPALLLVACILLGGCGSKSAKKEQPGTPSKITVATPSQYKDAALPLASKVLGLEDQLPDAGSFASDGFSEKATSLADEARATGDQIAALTPPQAVLTEHQLLAEGVTTIEFDLRDVASAANSQEAGQALKRTSADFDRLKGISDQIEKKLGSG
jgi:hypothetical protein